MENTLIQFTPSNRIGSIKPYFFSILNKKIQSLRSQKVDVIRIDMGSPDLPPPQPIIDKMIEYAQKKDTHGYTPYGGTKAYHEAVVTYYKTRYRVDLVPQKETLALIGSKEGLYNLTMALINPSDLVIYPDPGYSVYRTSALIAGAEVYPLPLVSENKYLPDLDAIPADIFKRAKLLWLNYPNMPTGAVAPYEFFEKVIWFGRKYRLVIAHDNPYSDVCFDQYKAPSILEVPGAKDVAVEFNSLSKTYNMAGWRIGMLVGNEQIVQYVDNIKSQMDSGHFEAVLQAGIFAMTSDQSWIVERNNIYRERRDIVLAAIRTIGLFADTPPASLYVWAKLPENIPDSLHFCDQLLNDTGVSLTPGVVFGQCGEGYIRISLGTSTTRIEEAMTRVVGWYKGKYL
jgi:LL-diaminopimelate aminotransferase